MVCLGFRSNHLVDGEGVAWTVKDIKSLMLNMLEFKMLIQMTKKDVGAGEEAIQL